MRVSTRLILALCVVTGAFMGALLILRSWQGQNVQHVLEDRGAAMGRFSEKAIEIIGKPLQAYTEDYSFWTEMVDFVGSGDPGWAEENLPTGLKTFDADAVWVFRPDATQVYFGTRLEEQAFGDLLPFKGQAERLFSESRFAHFFFHIPAGVMEVRGATIHPSSDPERKTAPAGYFIAGRLWGQGQLDRLSGLLDGTSSIVPREGMGSAGPVTAFEGGTVVFHHPLNAWDGTALAVLEIRSTSPVVDRFVAESNWGLVFAAVFSLFLLGLFAALLARWIATPLRMISDALAKGDLAFLGGLEKSRSEYGTIARLVTAHFAQSGSLARQMAERGQTEAALRTNEANLSSLLNAIHESVFLMDRNGTVLVANATFAERLGLGIEACAGKSVYELISAEVAETRREWVERVFQTGQPLTFEDARSGICMLHSLYPVFTGDGGVDRVVVYAMDITERKQAEAKLRESQELFSNAFAHAASGMALVSLDGRWISANSAVCEMLGYSEDELLGMTFQEVTVPEDLDTDLARVGQLLAGEIGNYHLEKRYHHKEGRVVWAMLSVSLVRNEQGEPACFISQIQNITERHLVEEALRESEYFSREIQRVARLGGWKANPHTDYLEWSDGVYELVEAPRDYAPSLTEGLKFYLPEYIPIIRDSVGNCLNTGEPFCIECEVITTTGRRLWTEVRGLAPVTEGERSYVMGTFQDITERKRAEEALRENQEWLALAQSAGHVGTFDYDIATNETKWSPELEEMFGLSDFGVSERYDEWMRRVHPDDLKRLEEMLAGAENPHFHEAVWEYRFVRNGEERWLVARGSVLRDGAGKPVRLIGTNVDITERKRIEEDLRHRENLLSKVFDILPVGLWFADGKGTLLRGNPAGLKIWGSEPLVGPQEYGQFRARRLPSGQEIASDDWALSHTVNEGVTIVDEELEIEAFDGVTRTILNYTAPVLDDSGNVEAAVVVNLDITERKRVEEAWRVSQARYRSLFESSKDGIVIIDAASGRIVDANPSILTMADLPWGDMVGREFWEAAAFRDIVASREDFDRLREGDFVRHEETRLIRKNGTGIPVEFVSSGYSTGNDRVVQCNIRDISERRRLEDQLRQVQKMDAVGQLAGGVAHDFNNLLQVILGNVGLVQRMQAPGAPTWDEVDEVRKAAERAAELTQQLLAFSRRQTIQPVYIDLNELVQGVLKMLRRLIGERIELCFIPGSGLDKVHVDKGQIEQVLMNLSVNARDAMPRGGKLTIRTENAVLDAAFCRDNPWAVEGRHALVTVTDTGRGMDAATRARIFEPFFTTKEVGQGTGLGLATVYGIIKQHNGLVHVDSLVQKGTTFSLYLPVAKSPVQSSEVPAKQPVWGGNETILVAEDEPAVLNLIASLLRTVGYSVLTASDGNEAVRVFDEHGGPVDLAVLDVVMPGLSGREAMERMKVRSARTRFLFSSGYSASSIHRDFVIDEGLHLIRKPYRREDLLRAVRQILDAPEGDGPQLDGAPPGA